MSARSARRPVPALVFLLALAVLAVVVWVRVADRDSSADAGASGCATAPQLPANAAVTVTVLNGAGKDGLASGTLDAFVAAGFARGNYDNADATLPGVATVTAGPNGNTAALLVSYYLPGSTIAAPDDRGDTSVTVTLGQAFTALANATQVKAALAKAQVSQTVPAPKPTAKPTATTAPTGATTTAASAAPAATCTTTPPIPTPAGSGASPATSPAA